MSSVENLLKSLSKIDETLDFANTLHANTQSAMIESLARSACIQSFSVFEQFLRDRAVEWSNYLSQKRIAPTNLPSNLNDIQKHMVGTLPKIYTSTPNEYKSSLIENLAESFGSFSANILIAHELFFLWKGSNIQDSDIEHIISLSGAKNPWSDLTRFWGQFDSHKRQEVDAKSLFKELALMRHTSAHDASKTPPQLNALAATRQVKLLCVMIDGIVSTSLWKIGLPQQRFSASGSNIGIRKVVKDGKVWKEFSPLNSYRAVKRHNTLEVAMQESPSRSMANGDFILALDEFEIVNWKSAI